MEFTKEQAAAIQSAGKTIVSASAGSGKTFVMINKLVAAIEGGADLDSVLAVTFTKKAAAQMKEKLRSAIIARMDGADDTTRARLKVQLSKVPTASISTIHAFCAKLLRTYFYTVGIDGTFDIISADDSAAKEFKSRALDNLFDRYYSEDNADFKRLLKCYRKKRSDSFLRGLILSSYEKIRVNANYTDLLSSINNIYAEGGFERVCKEYSSFAAEKFAQLKENVESFAKTFECTRADIYNKIFNEMKSALDSAAQNGIFSPLPPLSVTRKPVDKTDTDKLSGESYKQFRASLADAYKAVYDGFATEAEERERFYESGKTAVALANILLDFDNEYTAIKRDENKLDYNDLEHLTLALLNDSEALKEIKSTYTCVYVDEYQDVNPVQEEIIEKVGGENVFLVGDVKQAIYGFRGSKSLFFAQKFSRLEGGDGNALRLSSNFRSSDKVLDFVNALFSQVMTELSCGFDYSRTGMMYGGGGYPKDFGEAQIHIFGKDEKEAEEREVYSVKSGAQEVRHTREGLAVLEIVERELKSQHYDLKSGCMVDTQAGDICILTRKRGNDETAGIVRALTDAGYPVAGAQEGNICDRPEVKEMLDILSYIDNVQQDIPLATALLSPLGNMSCDELAAIRIAAKNSGRETFRSCCKKYAERFRDTISQKLEKFYARIAELRSLSEVFTAAEIIDKILEDTYLEATYASGGGEKLKSLRRLAAEGSSLSVSAFLAALKEGGYDIPAQAAASSDSIKVMTMHASKGLEFPVVIIADICATFKGREQNELPFDEVLGFAPVCHDEKAMLTYPTVLRRLVSERAEREELKNELNLFYVACTRAMCRLHVMAKEYKPYNAVDAAEARCYAQLFDTSLFGAEELPARDDFKGADKIPPMISNPDEEVKQNLSERFMREYQNAESVNLPVKSSASAILKLSDEDYFRPHELFSGEGETGTERGTAYHRFLELCDFSIKGEKEIAGEIEKFVSLKLLTEEQKQLLSAADLAEILSMPVFDEVAGARLFREQEFLCRLPANEILDSSACDEILVQGAIDLLAETRGGFRIIDYKYSHKDDEALIKTYSRQLALYKKAVALIMHVDEASIKCAIVNIFLKRQIVLN
ncbi:MAG: UvrD-helicase domain-containing protein [Clostridia bacterium]|nr:UvrD-helicase domain-containing protein [Clostridia bacterium]